MITYRSRWLRRGEIWYDNEPGNLVQLDWLLYRQRSRPVPGTKARFFYTYLVDLTRSVDDLLAALRKETAYKLRRARERDRIVCELQDPRERHVMDEFERMYNTFAAVKGLSPLQRPRMQSLAESGLLHLSLARTPEGQILLSHANYHDQSRAALLELPSLFRTFSDSAARNLVGRANRLLIWNDIVRYKALGLKFFDFGGWYYGSDADMLKVNEFKKGFGGEVVREFQCEQILTLKAWLVINLAAVKKSIEAACFSSPAARVETRSADSKSSGKVPATAPALASAQNLSQSQLMN